MTTGRRSTTFQRGDVVLVRYPYTDLSSSKARPAVVLSSDAYHREQPDVILPALTTDVHAATGALDDVLKEWPAAGLRFPTAFKPVLATLEPSLIVHRIGSLAPGDFREVADRVRAVLGF